MPSCQQILSQTRVQDRPASNTMASSTSDDRRFSILAATNAITVCALVWLTVYSVSMNSHLFNSIQDMEAKFQAFKMDGNMRTTATTQQLQKLTRELHRTRQRRSLDLWRMTGIPNRIFNGTMFVPVLLRGAPGPKGPPGKMGPQGHTGPKGKEGKRGRRGKPGPIGIHGIKGDPGSIGMPGPRGTEGKVGAKGQKGDRGERGLTGRKGESVAVPKITVPPSDQTVVSPGTATFSCEATGNPKPIVTILPKGKRMDKRYKDIGEGMLEVLNVTFQDHGEIECVAKSVIGEDRNKANLKVLVKAQAMIHNKTMETEEGHDITIRCEVKGNPTPTITWQRKGGSKLPATANLTDNHKTLQIANAKIADSGEYVCEAVNSLNMSRSATTVKVTRKLAFAYRQRGTLTANEKNSIALTCLYQDGLPPVSAIWTKDGVKINANKKTSFSMKNQVLELTDLEMGNAGNYTCIIKSQVYQIQNTVRLIVRFLPSTCDRIRKSGQLKSGQYQIYPSGDQSHTMLVYCDMDSKPGEGIALYKTCSDVRKSGQLKSGQYHIYPTGDPSQSAQVYCDMNSKPGEGITVISHDNEARTLVYGFSAPIHEKIFKYEMTNQQIKALKQNSKSCEQHVKLECRGPMNIYETRLLSSSGARIRALRMFRDNCSSDRFPIGRCENFEQRRDLPIVKLENHLVLEDFAYTIGKLKCY